VSAQGAASAPVPAVPASDAVGQRLDAMLAVLARDESPAPEALCLCGCGRPVASVGLGRPRRYATAACRHAVFRRRRAGVPDDMPRQGNDHGRRSLASARKPALERGRAGR
jgi:hypothetical protein